MGYLCPVCDTPQPDGEHLANHLAITAMVRDEDHATWLDDHAEGWRDASPNELAGELVDQVDRVDYDEVAVERSAVPESATEGGHAHDHGDEHGRGDGDDRPGVDADASARRDYPDDLEGGVEGAGAGEFDDIVEEAIAEAREMTRQQFEDAAVEGDDEEENADGDAGDDERDGTAEDPAE